MHSRSHGIRSVRKKKKREWERKICRELATLIQFQLNNKLNQEITQNYVKYNNKLSIVKKRALFIFAIAGMAVNVCLFTSTTIMGILDTSYIASLSQAMPLERMLSKPIEMPIHLLSYLGVGAALIVQAMKKEKQ